MCTLALVCGSAGVASASQIHDGDELSVMVYNHPELSEKVTVSPQGTIAVPLAGTVSVAGMQTGDVATKLQHVLSEYIRHPGVEVSSLTTEPQIFVEGGPGGIIKYQDGETLSAAIADINVTDHVSIQRSSVDLRRISVLRDRQTLGTYDLEQSAIAGSAGPKLLPGDTILFVNKPIPVRVLGQVKVPGTTFLSSDQPLSDAIAQAYGVTLEAATSRVILQRDGQVSVGSVTDSVFHQPAQRGDTIEVPEAPRVSITGGVNKPGTVVLNTDFSLLSAIYTAGGPLQTGDISKVRVVHDGVTQSYNLTTLAKAGKSTDPAAIAASDPTLADGDVVFVPTGKQSFNWNSLLQAFSSAAWILPHF